MINEGWALLGVSAFWGWIIALTALIITSFPARGLFRARAFHSWGTAVVLFYLVWVVAMLKA